MSAHLRLIRLAFVCSNRPWQHVEHSQDLTQKFEDDTLRLFGRHHAEGSSLEMKTDAQEGSGSIAGNVIDQSLLVSSMTCKRDDGSTLWDR